MASERFNVRRFRKSDIPFALEQAGREGWDSTAELFDVFLEHDPDGCFVAEVEGEPVGMITTTRFESSAWIGNLIVSPAFRGSGIGTCLMEHALGGAGREIIRLEADPMGVNIYRKLGFVDEFESPRFLCEPDTATGCSSPAGRRELEAIIDLDREIFGADRFRLLRSFSEIALAFYTAVMKGKPKGYLMVLPSEQGVRFGPCVAAEKQAAVDLYARALEAFGGIRVVTALPVMNRDGIEMLERLGFRPGPSCLRMIKGPDAASGQPGRVYAIASGACG